MLDASECLDLVSIIIPVYNTGAVLRETLDSCLNQTYSNLEILVVDDHSNDAETLDILKEYAQQDERIRIVTSRLNHGLGYSRNLGVNNCTGKYFTFLDSDDLLSHDFVEKMLEALINNKADMAECSLQALIDESETEIKTDGRIELVNKFVRDFSERFQEITVLKRQCILKSSLLFQLRMTAWARLFVKDSYVRAKLCFANVRYSEDQDWTIRVFSSLECFVFVPMVGYSYRLQQNSISGLRSLGFFKGMPASWKRIYDWFSQRSDLNHMLRDVRTHLCSDLGVANGCMLLNASKTQQECQENLQYLINTNYHCDIDLEKGFRRHCFDIEASFFLPKFAMALGAHKPLPKTLVVSFQSLLDNNDPEQFYCCDGFQQLGRDGLKVVELTTDASSQGISLPHVKDLGLIVQKFVDANQDKISNLRQSHDYGEGLFMTGYGYNICQVMKIAHQRLQDGQCVIPLSEKNRFVQRINKFVANGQYKTMVLIGRDPLIEAIGKAHTGLRKVHMVLSRELKTQELYSGELEPSSWADATVSLSSIGYLLPCYQRLEPKFGERKYVTIVCPNCEHGLAIAVKLMLIMRQRQPAQEFLFVLNPHDDFALQMCSLHTSTGQSFRSLEPDLSNLRATSYPEDFSMLWRESKVILQLSPVRPNCHGLSLEALYNCVPVLATEIAHDKPLGTINCQVPAETQQDITCLPDDSSMDNFVEALEKLLSLSEVEVKQSCEELVNQYQQVNPLNAWLDVITGNSNF